MLSRRIASAAVGGPLLLLAVWAGGWWLAGTAAAVALLAGREWLRLWGVAPRRSEELLFHGVMALTTGMGALSARPWADPGSGLRGALAVPALAALVAGLGTLVYALTSTAGALARRDGEQSPSRVVIGAFTTGWLFIGLPLAHWPVLRQAGKSLAGSWPSGPAFWLLAVVWLTDAAAYFAGLSLGRRRLALHLSPAKSVEGAAAGLAAGVAAAVFLRGWPGWSTATAALAGVAVSATGQLGDLWESALKREAGVKDSGTLIPGHGGVLDRFDALLTALPVTYYLALWFHYGAW